MFHFPGALFPRAEAHTGIAIAVVEAGDFNRVVTPRETCGEAHVEERITIRRSFERDFVYALLLDGGLSEHRNTPELSLATTQSD